MKTEGVDFLPDYLERVLDASTDACVVLNPEQRVLYYNRPFEQLVRRRGMRPRTLLASVQAGIGIDSLIPIGLAVSDLPAARALRSGAPVRVDEVESNAFGDDSFASFSITAVPLPNGCAVQSFRDVTAEVRMQHRFSKLLREQRRVSNTLEQQVQSRTRELEQVHDKLILQEKLSALGRLVAGIAHELNNPINFVYGNIEFLAQYVDDLVGLIQTLDQHPALHGEARNALEQKKKQIGYDALVVDLKKLLAAIENGAERTASIVRDLKNFSRTGPDDQRRVDIVTSVDSTLTLLSGLFKNNIEIRKHYASNLPKVLCNPGHVGQVFMNILANAAQAIEGRGTIDITIEPTDHGEGVTIAIEDSGKGMSEDVMKKMVDPFFTTKPVGEGTGLGLWITQNIVDAHNGELRCTSSPGRGTKFTVVLPVDTKWVVEEEAHSA